MQPAKQLSARLRKTWDRRFVLLRTTGSWEAAGCFRGRDVRRWPSHPLSADCTKTWAGCANPPRKLVFRHDRRPHAPISRPLGAFSSGSRRPRHKNSGAGLPAHHI